MPYAGNIDADDSDFSDSLIELTASMGPSGTKNVEPSEITEINKVAMGGSSLQKFNKLFNLPYVTNSVESKKSASFS